MAKSISIFLSALFVTLSIIGRAQSISKSELDSIYKEVEGLLGDDWFLTPIKSGFQVTFCRSCHEEYIDSFNFSFNSERIRFTQPRSSFFTLDQADSVCYYPTCCHLATEHNSDSIRHLNKLKDYKANGTMSFQIIFKRKWSAKKYNSTYENNQLLKDEILKEPIYKTSMDIFSDYRFWLPSDYLKNRTKKYNFYFERLPYSSESLSSSIFIIPDKPGFGCEPVYVDKNEREYYDNESNFVERERRRTLKTIATVLRIRDFKIVN